MSQQPDLMKNILILDDNRDILTVLKANLCHFLKDCRILTATNGQKGIEVLRSEPIDLVVTDLDMPRSGGLEFIRQAREHFPGVRLCVMTGLCSAEAAERLRSLGVSRTIEKPFPYGALAKMIDEELAAGSDGAAGCRDKPC